MKIGKKGKIGINSMPIKQFDPHGWIDLESVPVPVDVVELSFADVDFIEMKDEIVTVSKMVREWSDMSYTVHAPHQTSEVRHLRINLGEVNNINMKIMEEVIKVSSAIEAEGIVIHAGDNLERKSVENAIKNIQTMGKLAMDYGIYIAVENIFSSESGTVRIGETPDELLHICEEVSMDNVGATIDVGHAFISSMLHSLRIEDYFEILRDYILHLHIHNNYGIQRTPWDSHLPLFNGLIDYSRILNYLNGRNIILEIKSGLLCEILASLDTLRKIDMKVVETGNVV